MQVLKHRLALLVAAMSLFAAFPLAIHAVEYDPLPVYEITCTGINELQTGSVYWTRDTSGTGSEILRYEVSDGDGTILFLVDDSRSVGSDATLPHSAISARQITTRSACASTALLEMDFPTKFTLT